MRYEIKEEIIKDGRKKIKQYVVWDNIEFRVIVRYAKRKDAEDVLVRYQSVANKIDTA